MNLKAIFKLYPNVVQADALENGTAVNAYDEDGNEVTIDYDLVNNWNDPDQYKIDRTKAYPSIQEQLDMQYWDSVNGTTTWAEAIAAVKEANPKPE
jgi:hypothetical protein